MFDRFADGPAAFARARRCVNATMISAGSNRAV
jgi:hypothetical protein